VFKQNLMRPALIAAVAAVSVAVVPATGAQAAKRLVHIDRCAPAFADAPVTPQTNPESAELSVNCLVNKARKAAGVGPLQTGTGHVEGGRYIFPPLSQSARAHARASVAAKSWDVNRGLVSHLNPGTPVPADNASLQQLANQHIDGRIRGAGYCAGGSSYRDAENTYAGWGSGATPRAAVNWWLSDPPHRATLIDPNLTEHGIGVAAGSPFPTVGDAGAAAFVEDLGTCH
jgi:uncharacterized protein YkwD